MPQPLPLPSTIPPGTKFTSGVDIYEFFSVGVMQSFKRYTGTVFMYVGDVVFILTGAIFKNYEVDVNQIHWDQFTEAEKIASTLRSHVVKIDQKYCFWCNDGLGLNQEEPYCIVGKVRCKDYYLALKERMELDFRSIDEALPGERDAAKRWVDGNFSKK